MPGRMVYPDKLWECHYAMAWDAVQSTAPWAVVRDGDDCAISICKDGVTMLDLEPTFKTECAVNLVVELLNRDCRSTKSL